MGRLAGSFFSSIDLHVLEKHSLAPAFEYPVHFKKPLQGVRHGVEHEIAHYHIERIIFVLTNAFSLSRELLRQICLELGAPPVFNSIAKLMKTIRELLSNISAKKQIPLNIN